ncbi:peptidyl-prolyl cis-trans isomerase D [Arboricoccus pini]|uniref:Parvulin-like PPIase n=1 Tax=Arboricoccus pini TaxID=1963835 RepID=A0A212QP30_9PROT|nr:peptidylprolyl isomerase [Arboricoccus pini]SNB61158.1 peptidyl-prolyl cis-trans isomerase D [Arboricoccus pini]
MLDALRSRASSWVVKILLLLLVVSFVIWGIGDVFRGDTSTDVVAKVDGLPVRAPLVEREARQQMNQLQQQMGGKLPPTPAIMNSLRQQALNSAIARRLLDAHAADLGLVVPDELLVQTVRQEPSFQDQGGFNRPQFEAYLQQVGFTETDFFEQLRGDILRGDLVGALTAGARSAKAAAQVLAAYQNEKRAGRALIVENSAMQVPEPDDATLSTYLEANKNRYQAPEYRRVEIAIADAQSLASEQQISEADAKTYYDANLAKFTKPETRTAEQLLASDSATLEEAGRQIAAGKSPSEVAQALKDKGVSYATLGPVAKGQLPEKLDTSIWGLQLQGVSSPVEDSFGWHLIKLTAIEPEIVTPFDQAKAQIEKDLALRHASEQLPEITNQLDDALGGGASLADAAARAGLQVQKIAAVDRNGQAPDGSKIVTPTLDKRMLDEIFATGEGQTSLLITDNDGRYFVVSVSAIQPPRTKTLAEARDELVKDWRQQQASDAAQKLAAALLDKAKTGESLEALAAENPGTRLDALPLTARTPPKDAPPAPEATPALFDASKGKPVDHVVPVQGGSAVVVLDNIEAADPKTDLKPILDGQTAGLANDLIQDYEAALRQRYAIQTYPQAMAALMQRSEP